MQLVLVKTGPNPVRRPMHEPRCPSMNPCPSTAVRSIALRCNQLHAGRWNNRRSDPRGRMTVPGDATGAGARGMSSRFATSRLLDSVSMALLVLASVRSDHHPGSHAGTSLARRGILCSAPMIVPARSPTGVRSDGLLRSSWSGHADRPFSSASRLWLALQQAGPGGTVCDPPGQADSHLHVGKNLESGGRGCDLLIPCPH